jgi:hypothetical protein
VFGVGLLLGYAIPVIDYKLFNTFLGATHFPPGAIGALLVLVLVVNPLLRMVSKKLAFSRNEALTVYITCLFSSLIPGHGAEIFSSRICFPRSTSLRAKTSGWSF